MLLANRCGYLKQIVIMKKTPKQKAKDLIELFSFKCIECDYLENAKMSARLCVEEILHSEKLTTIFTLKELDSMEWTSDSGYIHDTFIEFYEKVLEEIINYEND